MNFFRRWLVTGLLEFVGGFIKAGSNGAALQRVERNQQGAIIGTLSLEWKKELRDNYYTVVDERWLQNQTC